MFNLFVSFSAGVGEALQEVLRHAGRQATQGHQGGGETFQRTSTDINGHQRRSTVVTRGKPWICHEIWNPDAPCVEYLPTFGSFLDTFRVNVGTYSMYMYVKSRVWGMWCGTTDISFVVFFGHISWSIKDGDDNLVFHADMTQLNCYFWSEKTCGYNLATICWRCSGIY